MQLFKLFHNERDIEGLNEELGRKQKIVGKENAKKEKIEEEIRDKKKEGGKLSREFTKIEQNIKETVSAILSLWHCQFLFWRYLHENLDGRSF